MSKPRINLMIMREGEVDQAVRSYSIPGYLPRLAIVLAAAVAIFLTTVGIGLVYFRQRALDADALRVENQSLRASLSRAAQLEQELNQYRRFIRRVSHLIGIDVPVFDDSLTGPDWFAETGGSGDSDATGAYGIPFQQPLENASPAAGVLVVNCRPDPNNRPRGLPVLGRLSRGFSPVAANPELRHNGIDIAAREGSPVFAPAAGTVIFAGKNDIYGLMLEIDHGNGFHTIFGHNSRLLAGRGQRVKRADVIALSGNTGVSTAPHLHYEIQKDGKPVDPLGFLGR